MINELYYCVGWNISDPRGERIEWRIHRHSYDESLYIFYNKGKVPTCWAWMWNEWYQATLQERQQFFKDKRSLNMKTVPAQYNMKVCDPSYCHQTLACTPSTVEPIYWAQKFYQQEGINPMNTLNATATVNTKTDLQTQREYLLSRHDGISRSFDYGTLQSKMSDAFNLCVSNQPETSKELFDGILSGKFKLDDKKAALQDIGAATDNFYDEDENFTGGVFYAINWGGLSPDRLGYEKARDAFRDSLKLAKDEIMTGDPSTSVKTLQALEAWTPPAAALPN